MRASNVVDRLGVTPAVVVAEPDVVLPATDDPGLDDELFPGEGEYPADELLPGVVGYPVDELLPGVVG